MKLKDIDVNHAVFQKASTYEEVATFLGTDAIFLQREVGRGNLRVRRFNRRMTRILPADLIEWLERASTIA